MPESGEQRPDASLDPRLGGMVVPEDLFLRSPIAILLIDTPTRTIVHANEAFCELLDLPSHRIRQAPIYEIDRASPDEVDEYLILAVACRDTSPRRRTFTGRNGVGIDVEVRSVPLGGERGTRLALFVRDVRDERRSEQDRNRLQSQLWMAQKHEAVGRLAAGIAHDFNNILSAVLLTTESLQKRIGADDPTARADLDVIADASLKARKLTRELLAFSGKQQLQPRPTNMNRVVEDMEELLRRTLPEDIDFVFRRCHGNAVVNADPSQMQQVLLNLVMNARDAMPGGGYLVVRVEEVDLSPEFARDYATVSAGPHVMLSVTDTGIGMEEDTQSRIFEPFFTTRERGAGAGLGLATVYGIVKQSGGSIWVTSESGVGTTFRVYLPRLASGTLDKSETPESAQEAARGSEHVLLVEDEADVRRVTARVLRELGYEVTEAKSPHEALDLYEELWPSRGPHPVDAVLTDVVMPGMSGVELVRRIHEKHEDLPVLFMSGYLDAIKDENSRVEAIEPRLSKPFTEDEIAQALRQILDTSEEPSPFFW